MLNTNQIKKALKDNGMSFRRIAQTLGVSTTSVSTTASRKTTSKRLAMVICLAINKPIENVFSDKPEYYKKSTKEKLADKAIERIRNSC